MHLSVAQLAEIIQGIPGVAVKWGDGSRSIAVRDGDDLILTATAVLGDAWVVTFHGEWTLPAYIPAGDRIASVAKWPRASWYYGSER